jgi:hypothetical protein
MITDDSKESSAFMFTVDLATPAPGYPVFAVDLATPVPGYPMFTVDLATPTPGYQCSR